MKRTKIKSTMCGIILGVFSLVLTSCAGEDGIAPMAIAPAPEATVAFSASESVSDAQGSSEATLDENSLNAENSSEIQKITATINIQLQDSVIVVKEFSNPSITSSTLLNTVKEKSTMTVTLSDGQVENLQATFPALAGYPAAELISAELVENETEQISETRMKVTSVWECQWVEETTGKRGTIVLRPWYVQELEATPLEDGYEIKETIVPDGNKQWFVIVVTRLSDGKRWAIENELSVTSDPSGMKRLDVSSPEMQLSEWIDQTDIHPVSAPTTKNGFTMTKKFLAMRYSHKWMTAGRTSLVGPSGEITMWTYNFYFEDPETGFSKSWSFTPSMEVVQDEIVDKGMEDIHIESGELGKYVGTHVFSVDYKVNGETIHTGTAETNLYQVEFN